MFTQSFLSGVMRCGGIGILRISDFSVVRWAEAGRGGNVGAEDCAGSEDASVSIMTSSSSPVCCSVCGSEACGTTSVISPASSPIASSTSFWADASVDFADFLCSFRLFFLCVADDELGSVCKTTILSKSQVKSRRYEESGGQAKGDL